MLSCLLVIVAILVPLTLLTFAVVNELSDFAQSLQQKPDGSGGAAGPRPGCSTRTRLISAPPCAGWGSTST